VYNSINAVVHDSFFFNPYMPCTGHLLMKTPFHKIYAVLQCYVKRDQANPE